MVPTSINYGPESISQIVQYVNNWYKGTKRAYTRDSGICLMEISKSRFEDQLYGVHIFKK